MGQKEGVFQFPVFRVDIGLVIEHVQSGSGQLCRFQGGNQGLVVNHAAPGRVDDDGPVGKPGDALGVQQAHRFGCVGAVERQELAERQHVVQILMENGPLFQGRIQAAAVVIVDFHVETPGPPGHYLAHPAHADDAQPLASHLDPDHEAGAPILPLARPHQGFAFAAPPGGAQQAQHGGLGGGVGQHVRGVGDDDALFPCRLKINVIHADGEIGDGFDASRQPGDDIGGKFLRVAGQDGAHAFRRRDQPIGRIEGIIRIEPGVIVAGQPGLHGIG